MERPDILGTERELLVLSHLPAARKDDCRSRGSDCSVTPETKEPASIPQQFLNTDIPDDFISQQFASRRKCPDMFLRAECDSDTVGGNDNPASAAQGSHSGDDGEPFNPEPHFTLNSGLLIQPESGTKQQEKALKPPAATPEKAVVGSAAGQGGTSDQEHAPGLEGAQSQILQSGADAWKQDELCGGNNITAQDRKPKADQENCSGSFGLSYSQEAELCEMQAMASLNLGCAKTGSFLGPAIISGESSETGAEVSSLSKWSLEDESTPASFTSDSENARRAHAKSWRKEKTDTFELAHGDGFASPEFRGGASRLAAARAARATFLHVSHVPMTDFCHAEERTMSSVLNPLDRAEACTETSVGEQVHFANFAQSAGAGNSVRAKEIKSRGQSESASCRSEAVNSEGGQGSQETAPAEESKLEVSSVEDTKVNVNSLATSIGTQN